MPSVSKQTMRVMKLRHDADIFLQQVLTNEWNNVDKISSTNTYERELKIPIELSNFVSKINQGMSANTMFEIISPTQTTILSFGNLTSLVATTFVFDNNASEFWNDSTRVGNDNSTDAYDRCDPNNPRFNCSVDDYLNFYLGAKQMPLETAIWVSLITNNFLINFQRFFIGSSAVKLVNQDTVAFLNLP